MQGLHIVNEEPSERLKKLEETYQSLRAYVLELAHDKSSFQKHEEKITHWVHEMGRVAMAEALSQYDVHSERIFVLESRFTDAETELSKNTKRPLEGFILRGRCM